MIAASEHLLLLLAITAAVSAVGQLAAWAIHKYTLLGAFNLYPMLGAAVAVTALGIVTSTSLLTDAGVVLTVALAGMVTVSVRRRAHALGGGGALRAHELSRRWLWQPGPQRAEGERVWLGRQGELECEKPWSPELAYVSLRARPSGRRRARDPGARLPLGEGQHVFMVGATGAGKTTTARRVLAARVLSQRSSLVILDQFSCPAAPAARDG